MKKNNKKGFTLVELVIVVAVMAILVAVAIPTIGSIRSTAQTNVQNSNAQTLESMIKLAESKYDTPTDQYIANELAAAKLGINSGSYTYDEETGECTYGYTAPAAGTTSTKVEVKFAVNNTTKAVEVSYNGAVGVAANAGKTE